MGNDLKWLIGSDFHIPYEDPTAMSIWWQVMEWLKPDVIDILGDLDDNSACSRYSDGTADEVINATAMYSEFVKQFFAKTRELNPDSQIHFATGNHEIRFDDYINKKAKAFKGLITPELLWGTDTHGIELSYYDKPPVHRFGDIWVHHGLHALTESGASVRKMVDDFGVSCIVGHCFSEDTEILTRSGWKTYQEVSVGDEVYTMDMQDGIGEYQAVSDKFVYDDYDELVSIKNRSIDVLVTPDHDMVIMDKTGQLRKVKAKDVPQRSKIPRAARSNQKDADISDERIKLLAWVVAEANFPKRTLADGRIVYDVRISQSDGADGRLKRLSDIMVNAGITPKFVRRYLAGNTDHGQQRNLDAYRSHFSRKESRWIFDYINPETRMPKNELLELSARQAEVFLVEYVWADGSKNSAATNSYQLATNKKYLADYLQHLTTVCGFGSSLIPRSSGVWCLTYNTTGVIGVRDGTSIETVPYSGNVWCVTVPNHTVVVRRSGKTFVAGNSHRAGSYFKTYKLRNETLRGYELGHMTDVASAGMSYDTKHNWQQGFAIAHIVNDHPHIQLISISDGVAVVDGKVFHGK